MGISREEKLKSKQAGKVERAGAISSNILLEETSNKAVKKAVRYFRNIGFKKEKLAELLGNHDYFRELKYEMEVNAKTIIDDYVNNLQVDPRTKSDMDELLNRTFLKLVNDTLMATQTLTVIYFSEKVSKELSKAEVEKLEKMFEDSYKKAFNNILAFMEDYKEIAENGVDYVIERTLEHIENLKMRNIGVVKEDAKKEEVKETIYHSYKKALKRLIEKDNKYLPFIYTKGGVYDYFSAVLLASGTILSEEQGKSNEIVKSIKKIIDLDVSVFPQLSEGRDKAIEYIIESYKAHKRYKKLGRSEEEKIIEQVIEKIKVLLSRMTKNNKLTIPKNSIYMAYKLVGDFFEDIVEGNPRIREGTIDNLDVAIDQNLLFELMEKKKLSYDPSVVNEYKREVQFPKKLRNFHWNISQIERDQEYREDIITIIQRRNVSYSAKTSTAYTDGHGIFVSPVIDFFNIVEMNQRMLWEYLMHEEAHIEYNSFKLLLNKKEGEEFVFDKEKIISSIRGIAEEKGGKEFIRFLDRVIERTNEEISRELKIWTGKKDKNELTIDKMIKIIGKIMEEEANDNEYIKKFVAIWESSSFELFNILEDRRIDNRRKNTLEELKGTTYITLKYIMMFLSARRYGIGIKNKITQEGIEGNLNKIGLALYYSKLGEVFKEFFDFESKDKEKYLHVLEKITAELDRHGEEDFPVSKLSSNIAWESVIEYIAAMALLEDIEFIEMKTHSTSAFGERGKRESGKEGENIGREGEKEGESVLKGEEEEGRGEKGDIARNSKIDMGKVEEEKIEQREGSSKTIMIPSREVDMYKRFFKLIAIGGIEEIVEYGKRGKLDVSKLIDLIARGENEIFKRVEERVRRDKKGNIFQNPVNIYIAIDTSGSMSGERMEISVQQAIAMFIGFKESLREDRRLENVQLKLVSMSDDRVVGSWDARKFNYSKEGNHYKARYRFHIGSGGTDLPAMLRSFEKVIENNRKKADKKIIKREADSYPSYLIISFTDFGDNAGDSSGFENAIDKFGEFAREYSKKSRPYRKSIGDRAGVALMFIAPKVDDWNIEKIAENKTNSSVVILNGQTEKAKEVVKKLTELLNVLNGKEETNIINIIKSN